MNELDLDRIHMTSANGTDLTVGLADDATWEGASSKTEGGIEFIANVPTEEVFCAPHRERTNGIVYGTKPYAYNGQLIEGWHVTFKDGVVVEHGAEKNADLLTELLSTDENSNRIGEIASCPHPAPLTGAVCCSSIRCLTRTPPATLPLARVIPRISRAAPP